MMSSGTLSNSFFILMLMTLWFGGPACTQEGQDKPDWEVQRHYQRGNQALGENNLEVAESEFRKVIELEADHLGAINNLARVLLRKADQNPRDRETLLGEALKALEKSVGLDPDGKLAWKTLARTYRLLSRVADARRAYAKLLELDDRDFESRIALAGMLGKSGKPDQAESVLVAGLKKHPGSPSLLLAYGRLLLEQKREKEAKRHLNAVKPDCAEYYEAQDELGSLAARQGDFDEVRRIYLNLVKINPTDYMAWELLAAVDERQKNFKGAEEKYRRSLEVDRVHMSAWLGLGRVLRAQDKREEAIYAFKKADGFIGSNPEQALELSDELAGLKEPAWALSVLERARIAAKDKKLLSSIEEKIKKLSVKQPSDK